MLNRIRIVLVHTSHPGNIGSSARAMKTMGLSQLYLVSPAQFPHPKAVEMATGASDLLDQAVIVQTLHDALSDCTLVIGTSTRRRKIPWPLSTPRELAEQIQQEPEGRIAILFGREQTGLTNEELEHCHLHVHVPANPDYSSLNIASAVQVIAYELRIASFAKAAISDEWDAPLASAGEMENFFAHLETVLIAIQFLKIKAPRKLMTRLRRLFYRARPDKMEVNMLRGFLTAIEKKIQK